jgi:LysM domain
MTSPSRTPRPCRPLLTRKHLTLLPGGSERRPSERASHLLRRASGAPRPADPPQAARDPAKRTPPARPASGDPAAGTPGRRAPASGRPVSDDSGGDGPGRRAQTSGRPVSGDLAGRDPARQGPAGGVPSRGGSAGGDPSRRGRTRRDQNPRCPAAGRGRRPHGGVERGAGPVRLTRRGKAIVVIAVVGLMLGAFWLGAERGAHAAGTPGPALRQEVHTVTVGRDDTLWEIAARTRPRADPQVTVRRIAELNGLSGSIVQPGQRLRLPAR